MTRMVVMVRVSTACSATADRPPSRWPIGGSKRSTQQERSDLFDRLLER